MLDERGWAEVRASFAGLEKQVYLNAAGMTPIPRPVFEAGQSALERLWRDVRGFATGFVEASTRARRNVAAFYGADADSMAFVGTTSLGMNMLAIQMSRTWPQRRHVVTLRDEFPSSTLAWRHHGFDVDYVEPDTGHEYSVSSILERVRPETCAVVLSYVQFGTGARTDVPSLAHELRARGVPCILNATQAAGVIPLDLATLPVSALLVAGNKWMLSGTGTAILYLSPELRRDGFPGLAGWLSAAQPLAFDNRAPELTRNAAGLELGLGSLVPMLCAEAAVEFISQVGLRNVEERIMQLTDQLLERLTAVAADVVTPHGRDQRAGLVCVRRADAHEWAKRLEEQRVIVVSRGPMIARISPHIYNTPQDIERLMELW